jgi:hypothetical protein
MKPDEFVEAVRQVVLESAVSGCIRSYHQPPGKRPSTAPLELSSWYAKLGEDDREMVGRALRDAADAAVFGFLCVLDGVRAIEAHRDKGCLELWYVQGNERILLNDDSVGCLHEFLASE